MLTSETKLCCCGTASADLAAAVAAAICIACGIGGVGGQGQETDQEKGKQYRSLHHLDCLNVV